ncbi:MAG: hypothetical protein COU44_01145 [Candidatus Nealsonbacteria bacterium CG10_big_fil_rev_8_21_14_0_10_40_24]|nr:MAG: hypothetical protein COU44_01145 [Candidatus Nealsonbacteria bacterium CG10_big_fil_rev_8_21_14_0_10_40_24]
MRKKIVLIMLGLPGSGKGTQAKVLVKKYNLSIISIGEKVRQLAKKDKEVNERQLKGQPQPDEVFHRILQEALTEDNIKNGFVIDTIVSIPQAQAAEKLAGEHNLHAPLAIYIKIKPETVIDRLSKRFICPSCQEIFYPLSAGYKEKICPKCHEKLIQREDDKPEAVQRRIWENQQRLDILEKYFSGRGELLTINGEPFVEDVTKEIFDKLEEKNK